SCMPFTQSCSVPICSTVPSEKPSIPTHVATYAVWEELRVRVGITQLPVTLFTIPSAGEDMLDSAAYPLQFELVPARIPMFGRENGELQANVTAKKGLMRKKANRAKPTPFSPQRKTFTTLGIVLVLRQCD